MLLLAACTKNPQAPLQSTYMSTGHFGIHCPWDLSGNRFGAVRCGAELVNQGLTTTALMHLIAGFLVPRRGIRIVADHCGTQNGGAPERQRERSGISPEAGPFAIDHVGSVC